MLSWALFGSCVFHLVSILGFHGCSKYWFVLRELSYHLYVSTGTPSSVTRICVVAGDGSDVCKLTTWHCQDWILKKNTYRCFPKMEHSNLEHRSLAKKLPRYVHLPFLVLTVTLATYSKFTIIYNTVVLTGLPSFKSERSDNHNDHPYNPSSPQFSQ